MSQTCERSTTEICGNPDHETCSWCLACVPDSSLKEMQYDGARICRECVRNFNYRREAGAFRAGF